MAWKWKIQKAISERVLLISESMGLTYFVTTLLWLCVGSDCFWTCFGVTSFSPYGRVRIRCFNEPSLPEGILKSADLPLDKFDSFSLGSVRYVQTGFATDELCSDDDFKWYWCWSRCCCVNIDGGDTDEAVTTIRIKGNYNLLFHWKEINEIVFVSCAHLVIPIVLRSRYCYYFVMQIQRLWFR